MVADFFDVCGGQLYDGAAMVKHAVEIHVHWSIAKSLLPHQHSAKSLGPRLLQMYKD